MAVRGISDVGSSDSVATVFVHKNDMASGWTNGQSHLNTECAKT
jgi:hypothetical protein